MGLLSRLPRDQNGLLKMLPASLPSRMISSLPLSFAPASTRRPVPSAPAGRIAWGGALSALVEAAFGPIDWNRENERYWRFQRFRDAVSARRQAHASAPDAPPLGLLRWLSLGGLSDGIVDPDVGQITSGEPETGQSAWETMDRRLARKEAIIAWCENAERERLELRCDQFEAAKSFLRRLGQAGALPDVVTLDEAGEVRQVAQRAWANDWNWRRLQEERAFESGNTALPHPGHPFFLEDALRRLCERVRGRGFEGFSALASASSERREPDEAHKDWLIRIGYAETLTAQKARELAQLELGPDASRQEIQRKVRSLQATVRSLRPSSAKSQRK